MVQTETPIPLTGSAITTGSYNQWNPPQPAKEVCPHCGYCPHCGRSNTQPLGSQPWIQPWAYPWNYPQITWTYATPPTTATGSTIVPNTSIGVY
jgi:hypothetical protein